MKKIMILLSLLGMMQLSVQAQTTDTGSKKTMHPTMKKSKKTTQNHTTYKRNMKNNNMDMNNGQNEIDSTRK